MEGNLPTGIPDKMVDKVPTFEEYKKDKKSAVSYIFMICFFIYFFYNEFIKRDDCGEKIAVLNTTITQKDVMINQLNERVIKLENAIDVKNGVIKEVKEVVKVNEETAGGLQ